MDNYGKTTRRFILLSYCPIYHFNLSKIILIVNFQLSIVNYICDSERIRTAIVRTGILNSIH